MTAETPRTASVDTGLTFWDQLRIQGRVIWALTMREAITRFGREGLGTIAYRKPRDLLDCRISSRELPDALVLA